MPGASSPGKSSSIVIGLTASHTPWASTCQSSRHCLLGHGTRTPGCRSPGPWVPPRSLPGSLGTGVKRVHVVDSDVDRLAAGFPRRSNHLPILVALRIAQHDHRRPESELRVLNDSVVVGVLGMDRETESLHEPSIILAALRYRKAGKIQGGSVARYSGIRMIS